LSQTIPTNNTAGSALRSASLIPAATECASLYCGWWYHLRPVWEHVLYPFLQQISL